MAACLRKLCFEYSILFGVLTVRFVFGAAENVAPMLTQQGRIGSHYSISSIVFSLWNGFNSWQGLGVFLQTLHFKQSRIMYLVWWLTTGWVIQDQIPVGVRVSAPVRTSPWTHPVSSTVGSRSFPEVEWLGCDNHPPPSRGKVQTSRAIPLLPFSAFMACYTANFTFCSLLCAA
jgi:hypothetical protein